MLDLILATDMKGGMGLDNKLPWSCKEDLRIFKQKTQDSVLIMGRVTVENIPLLENRTIICITHNRNLNTSNYKNPVIVAHSISQAVKIAEKIIQSEPDIYKKIFIAGGKIIYENVLNNYISSINNVHYSVIKSELKCDTFMSTQFLKHFSIREQQTYDEMIHTVYTRDDSPERLYLDLLKNTLRNGIERVGRNGKTLSVFGKHLYFNLRRGFPLLTTKKMFFRGVVEELLFFIRGETDSKLLENKKINIWSGNTCREFLDNNGKQNLREGLMGPMYGYQWRHYNAPYDNQTGKPKTKGLDQLKDIIQLIRTDPTSRRIILTNYNPLQSGEGVLYPCHSLILQFYVSGGYLDLFCYNRSSDLFLGLPFNIASTSLLLMLVAEVTGLSPGVVNISVGDAHIYEQHEKAVREQISRIPFVFGDVRLRKKISDVVDIENLTYDDFELINYTSHPRIKAPMIA